jgi:hypothetical protein
LSGLLKASAGGDTRALESFYDATALEALALATRTAFERREELLAQSYLQAWRDALRFDPPAGARVRLAAGDRSPTGTDAKQDGG